MNTFWKDSSGVIVPKSYVPIKAGSLLFPDGSTITSAPSGVAGGFANYANKLYQVNPGDPVHIRTNAGDTTKIALFNIYGNMAMTGLIDLTYTETGTTTPPNRPVCNSMHYTVEPTAVTRTDFHGIDVTIDSDGDSISSLTHFYPFESTAGFYGPDTIARLVPIYAHARSTGNVLDVTLNRMMFDNSACDTGTASDVTGAWFENPLNSNVAPGAIGNIYAFRTGNLTSATNNYAFYSEGGLSYFNGNIGIGLVPATTDSNLTVNLGGWFKRGLRVDGKTTVQHLVVTDSVVLGTTKITPTSLTVNGDIDIKGNKLYYNTGAIYTNSTANSLTTNANIIAREGTDKFLYLGGGDDGTSVEGGKILLYGSTHASFPNRIELQAAQGTHVSYFLSVGDSILVGGAKLTVPDYVFENSYKQNSISEMRDFYLTNKHLPTMPSAREVKSKAINVMDYSMKLLETIEVQAKYISDLELRILALEKDRK